MQIQIPVDSLDSFFSLSVVLSGTEYFFEFQWNSENEFWTFNLYTSDKQPITQGRKVVINYNLFENCSHELLPPGRLYAVDTSTTNAECGLGDLGNRIILVYTDDPI